MICDSLLLVRIMLCVLRNTKRFWKSFRLVLYLKKKAYYSTKLNTKLKLKKINEKYGEKQDVELCMPQQHCCCFKSIQFIGHLHDTYTNTNICDPLHHTKCCYTKLHITITHTRLTTRLKVMTYFHTEVHVIYANTRSLGNKEKNILSNVGVIQFFVEGRISTYIDVLKERSWR